MKDASKLCDFPENVFPIDMHCFMKNQAGSTRQNLEQILITSTDGKFHIIGKNGRIEKSIEAHRGAVLVGKWSTDGSSLLTGMEIMSTSGSSTSCELLLIKTVNLTTTRYSDYFRVQG